MSPDPRLYLSARRPCGKDDADPAIADALQQASCDPKLAEWAECERKTDSVLRDKLCEVEPPPGLRDRILAGGQFRRQSWWNWFSRPVWLGFRGIEVAAAAAAVILFVTALFQPQSSRQEYHDGSGWQEAAAVEVAAIEEDGSTGPLDHVVNDLPEIRAWLTARTCPTPAALPAPVKKLKIFGCAKREWRGQPLGIVCFAFDGGREVHLVTVDRRNLNVPPPAGRPAYAAVRGYETASWCEGDVAMMLIGKVQRSELEQLFRASNAFLRQPAELPAAVTFH